MSPGSKLADVEEDFNVDILPSFYTRYERAILGSTAVGLALTLWEWIGRIVEINPIFLSLPSSIVTMGFRMAASGEIFHHLQISGTEFFLGYLLAAVTAIPLGLLAGWHRRLNFILDPFLSALYATPRVALLPLVILWIGLGIWSKVAVVFLGAFFPICVSTLAGVKTVDQSHLMVARSFQGNDPFVFKTIVIPSCVPFILAGLRLGVGRALVSVVVGEFYAASAGIGFLIAVAGATFQTDKVFVGIGIVAAFGMVCNEILAMAERRVEKWRPTVHSSL